jgi:hypothetical protein
MRAVTAALVGALCAAAWSTSFFPIGQYLYEGRSAIGSTGFIFLIVAPVSAVVWAFVAWALLRLARFGPAWPTAVLGPVGTFVLAVAAGLGILMLRLRPSENDGIVVVTIAAAGGYALAAAVTARYGGRRDRTEHSGQDG